MIAPELKTKLLAIQAKARQELTDKDVEIYNAVFHAVTGKVAGGGCSGLCTTTWLIVRNYINRIKTEPPAPKPKTKPPAPKPKTKRRTPRKPKK